MLIYFFFLSGSLGLLDTIIKIVYRKFVIQNEEVPAENSCMHYYTTIMSFVMLAWFFSGVYSVYSEYPPNTHINMNDGLYCDKTLYYIVFWLVSMVFIFIAFFCLLGVLALCCTATYLSIINKL